MGYISTVYMLYKYLVYQTTFLEVNASITTASTEMTYKLNYARSIVQGKAIYRL